MSSPIFISYRRDDSSASAGRIFDRLTAKYSRDQIFMDVDSLEPGVDFADVIESTVASCYVLIAVIGKRWLAVSDDQGNRRLDNPDDFVRLEIATALTRKVRVIPILVDGASMPQAKDLPDDLRPLARLNAVEVNHSRFGTDLERLTPAIERALKEADAKLKPSLEQRRRRARRRRHHHKRYQRKLIAPEKPQSDLDGPLPMVKVQFGILDPHKFEAHKVVYVRVSLENAGTKSVRNPKITVHYSEPGIVHLKENSAWNRVLGSLGLYPLNPRILEANLTIRPGEGVEVLPIQYLLSRFQQVGIRCQTLMDDERPIQSGVAISIDEVPASGWKEKLGEENFFPVLTPCLGFGS